MWSSEIGTQACKIVHTATRHSSEKSSMNTGFRGALPMYDIFGCASDFAHNFRHLMPTTLNCGATKHSTVKHYSRFVYQSACERGLAISSRRESIPIYLCGCYYRYSFCVHTASYIWSRRFNRHLFDKTLAEISTPKNNCIYIVYNIRNS